MEKDKVFSKIREILVTITGLEEEEINAESSLMDDLGIESFDIVDLNFKLNEELGLDSEEKFLSLEGIIGNPDFVDEDNYLTGDGIDALQKRIASVPIEKPDDGKVSILDIVNRVTVNDLVAYVMEKKK